jgi:hypothetical protein
MNQVGRAYAFSPGFVVHNVSVGAVRHQLIRLKHYPLIKEFIPMRFQPHPFIFASSNGDTSSPLSVSCSSAARKRSFSSVGSFLTSSMICSSVAMLPLSLSPSIRTPNSVRKLVLVQFEQYAEGSLITPKAFANFSPGLER